ncbi:MAG: FAD-dependent oxidoreductase, partial [Gaiellaceae bacterium]
LALAALCSSAERHGATIHEQRLVGRLDELEADAVVVTAGAWASALLAEAGIELPVVATRETVCYFAHPPGPPSLIEYGSPRGDAYYALSAPGIGLKAGIHHAGAHDDPRQEGRPDPELVELTRAWVVERFPGVGPEPLRTETCLYTCSADERFVLERHGRIVVGSACSGHGFKFAPAVGRRLAALALR